jgi:hypothetical protein
MSIDQSPQNKMMTAPPGKKVFTFPGDGIWHPERIEAETREAAEAIYHTIKKLISGSPAGTSTTPDVPPSAPEQSTPSIDANKEITG